MGKLSEGQQENRTNELTGAAEKDPDPLYELIVFFQAEDGIRDHCVTGVQTCALPIWRCEGGAMAARSGRRRWQRSLAALAVAEIMAGLGGEIGRASCRERV